VHVADISERYVLTAGVATAGRKATHREYNEKVSITMYSEAEFNEELKLEVSLFKQARRIAFGEKALGNPWLYEVVQAPGHLYIVFAPHRGAQAIPRMVEDGAGEGIHDIYGFERFELPSLASGASLEVVEDEVHEVDEDNGVWLGGGIWNGIRPAVATLCRWLLTQADSLRGAAVLELGAGVHGLCGLFAAGLGASRVLLTDGETPTSKLFELLRASIERNRRAVDGCSVSCAQFLWQPQGISQLFGDGNFDWLLGSDISYLGIDPSELLSTLHAILSRPLPEGSRPPRVVLSHEHRTRDLTLLHASLSDWLEGDDDFRAFTEAATRWGLAVQPLHWQRSSRGEMRGQFCLWGHDVSVFEVLLLPDGS